VGYQLDEDGLNENNEAILRSTYYNKNCHIFLSTKVTLLTYLNRTFAFKLDFFIHYWVDIENLYYECLKDAYNEDTESKESSIRELNTSLSYIISKLQEYLFQLQTPSIIESYKDLNIW